MPATDPADQSAARELESVLRIAVERRERPPVELSWFLALPKRIRRSGKLLETALAESRVLLECVRADWTRTQQADREREERLVRAKALPRDLDCLRAPDPQAWNGLGRRKKRCRVFDAVGRAFTTRQQIASPPVPVRAVQHLDTLPDVPARPPTPPNLRTNIWNIPGLLGSATLRENYGLNTPLSPPSVPTPSTPVPIPKPATPIPAPAYPLSLPPGELTVLGTTVSRDLAYVLARGRHSWAPGSRQSFRDRALDVMTAQQVAPGALDHIIRLLYPAGVSRYDQALDAPCLEPLVDLVHGWYDICVYGVE
ncbi:hypothetical protein FRC12_023843 [Ceratobasidium sp. 428]|nr:hypothetical protein FRC12_023843 [Ceratobasidium sp. 428]